MGVTELILILFLIVLLFGARKLPGLARAIRNAAAEFKKGKDQSAQSTDKQFDLEAPVHTPQTFGKGASSNPQSSSLPLEADRTPTPSKEM